MPCGFNGPGLGRLGRVHPRSGKHVGQPNQARPIAVSAVAEDLRGAGFALQSGLSGQHIALTGLVGTLFDIYEGRKIMKEL